MMKQSKPFIKRGGFGYFVVGTLAVMVVLVCIIVITGRLAPIVLGIHAGDAPAMMTMPLFVYCIFADLILLEAIFLLFQPDVRKLLKNSQPDPEEKQKKLSPQAIAGIVCCALLLCSIVIAPGVCHVFTEEGVDSYVFVKTDSVAWEDIPLYELTFSQESGLELYLHFAKDDKIPMFGAVNSINEAFTEKYGSIYGFACHLKEQAVENGWNFKVTNAEDIKTYFKDSAYWEYIEKLIQE
ncbi:MAG: hypothetical protein IKW24_07855 [Clostridia bacterium]|nr:hypothetical protein [Clostridia bacterium]